MDMHDAAAGDAVIGQEEEQPQDQQDDPSSGSRASPKLQRAPSEQQQEGDGAKRGEGSSASLAESAQSERVLTTSAEDGEAGAPLPPPQAQEASGDGAPPTLGTLESIEVN